MIIKTKELKSASKILGMIPTNPLEDFVYLEPSEKRLYIANQLTACYIDLDIDGVEDTDSTMVIGRGMFQHLLSAGEELTINKDYSYSVGAYNGFIDHNETMLDALSSIKSTFDNEDFELSLVVDAVTFGKIAKANIFVNPEDNNVTSQGVHINEKTISSSSLYRFYVDAIDSDATMFIHHSMLKFIFELGEHTSILKQENTFKLQNNNICMIFTGLHNVEPLPVNSEKFVNACNAVRDNTQVKVTISNILPKVDFMSFFSKQKVNNLSTMKFDTTENKLYILVDNNTSSCDCSVTSDDLFVEFNYDNSVLKDILTKVNKDIEAITLYCSNDSKLVIAEFSKEQYVVFAKINV